MAPGLVPNSSPQHNPFFTRRVGGMRRNLSSYRDTRRVVIHIFGTQFDWARLITVRARAEPVFADGSRKKRISPNQMCKQISNIHSGVYTHSEEYIVYDKNVYDVHDKTHRYAPSVVFRERRSHSYGSRSTHRFFFFFFF